MDIIYDILTKTVESFDFGLVASINIATYIMIKVSDGIIKLTTWGKRLVLLFNAVWLSLLYCTGDNVDTKLILNSCILAPVAWSWLGKPICKLFNIDYKEWLV